MDIIQPSVSPKIINKAFTTVAAVAASIANGTGTLFASPTVLTTTGANTINVTGAGNFVVTLPVGCNGVALSGPIATVTGSPVALIPGINTIVVVGVGNIAITLMVDNDLVTIPPIQTGYVTRLAVSNPTVGTANLMVRDVYTPDASHANPIPTLQVKDRYPISITTTDFIDINGHKISKHMGLLRVSSDTAGVIIGYLLELE
jgi:hypothetical protein